MGHHPKSVRVAEGIRGLLGTLRPTVTLPARAGSLAASELAIESDLVVPGLDDPIQRTHKHIRQLSNACIGFAQDLAALLETPPPHGFGAIPIARSLADAGSQLFFLTDPDMSPEARVGGYLAFLRLELSRENVRFAEESEYYGVDALDGDDDEQARTKSWTEEQNEIIESFFEEHPGVEDRHQTHSEMVENVFAESAKRLSGYQDYFAGDLGLRAYGDLAAVSHAFPRGLRMLTESAGGKFALTTTDIGSAMFPAVESWLRGVERTSAHFGWLYDPGQGDKLQLQIREMSGRIPTPEV